MSINWIHALVFFLLGSFTGPWLLAKVSSKNSSPMGGGGGY